MKSSHLILKGLGINYVIVQQVMSFILSCAQNMKRSNVSSSSDEPATELRDTNADYSIILGPEGP